MTYNHIDGFSPRAREIRECALGLNYGPQEYQGSTYTGIGMGYDPAVVGCVEHAVGAPVSMRMQFFRLGLEGDLLEQPTHIHADISVSADWAGIWYLTPDALCRGGTAFWRHRQTGLLHAPAALTQAQAEHLAADGLDQSCWEQIALARMRFNRFAWYPTSQFHSRWPRKAFGDTPENGRLVWVCFFDVSGE